MNIRKVILSPWYLFRKCQAGFNIYKTCLINYKFLPWKQACRFPIHVYGKLHLSGDSGKILIESEELQAGMITFGANFSQFEATQGITLLDVSGVIRFQGYCRIGHKCTLSVKPSAAIFVGNGCRLSNGVKIKVYKYIEIQPFVAITSECQVFDTNFHYMRDTLTGLVQPLSKPVVIGRCSWVGNRTTIMKGSVLPPYTIVSSNSLVTRDYSNLGSYCVIGGMPAKLLKEHVTRVYEWDLYSKLDEHFAHSDEPYQTYTGIINEEEYIEKAYFH